MRKSPVVSKSSKPKEKQRAAGASSQMRHGGSNTEPKPSRGADTDVSKQLNRNRDSRYCPHQDRGDGSLRVQKGSGMSENTRNNSNGIHSSGHRPSNPGVAAVDSRKPLSKLGQEFLAINNDAYEQCYRFLDRHSKLDFNHNQILLAVYEASTPEVLEGRVKKALLLFQWEHLDPASAAKYFQNLNNTQSREYAKFRKRVSITMEDVNLKQAVDKMPFQTSRTMSRADFLVPGRVIAVHGKDSDDEVTDVDTNRNNNDNNNNVHELPRHLVVIRTRSKSDLCLCVPIVSSNGRRPGDTANLHNISSDVAILFVKEDAKPERLPIPNEPRLSKRPIAIKLAPGACLPKASWLCFHQSESLWRVPRVEDVGMVTPNCIPLLGKYLHESGYNTNLSEGT